MRLVSFFWADAVSRNAAGGFDVRNGGADGVRAKRFPAAFGLITVLLVDCDANEVGSGTHQLRLEYVDPDGELLASIDQPFDLRQNSKDPRPRCRGVVVIRPPSDLAIPSPGDYAFHVSVDGEHLGGFPLYARLRN